MNFLKYILISIKAKKEEGFTIPLVLGIGLIMLLTGITAIRTSSTSRTDSQAKETSAQALSAAEVGLARIQALVDAERQVAVYPDCAGTRDANDVCPDSGTTGSWSNASAIATSSSTSLCGTTVNSDNLSIIEAVASATEWQDINPGNPDDGQYRLVSYNYSPTVNANEPPGIGELIVEGRTSQGVAGATKTDQKAYNTGIARIRAEIPVGENPQITSGSVPGLWVKYNVSTDLRNDKFNGDILIEGCLFPPNYTDASDRENNLLDPSTQDFIFSPSLMPDTPELPDPEYLIGDGVESADQTPANDPPISDAFDHSLYPRPEDDPGPDGFYHYLIGEATVNGGSDIEIDAGAKVIFYLQGDLDMSGNPSINMLDNGNTPANLQIYGNVDMCDNTGTDPYDTCPNGTDDDNEYKYGCPAGGSCPTTKMYFNGTGDIKALVHAPDAFGLVKGGGDVEGQFKGTLWVNNWLAGTGNPKVKVDAVGQLSDLISASTTTEIEPQITVTSSWVRQEVPE